MQGTGKSAAAGPELEDSIKMIGRVVLEMLLALLVLHTQGQRRALGKRFLPCKESRGVLSPRSAPG